MAYRIVAFREPGLIVKRRWSRQFTVAYGEILTAERLARPWGLRLHLRTGESIRIRGSRRRTKIEDELRGRGVRIVDGYGAIISPTLADFETELANEPLRLRQSSDSGRSD
jgi:hypothetical protein